ncbi:MAG: hypothetical protein KC912_10900 [Proteobacteria bacterium]|nr:hypothetical protein [Pseudomonadota bacterium]
MLSPSARRAATLLGAGLVYASLALPMSADAKPTETLSNGATVELLSKGKGPKQTLRYAPEPGTTEVMAMTTNLQMSMDMAGNAMPTPAIPASTMKLAVTIDRVEPNGDIVYSYEIADAKVDETTETSPEVIDSMRGSVEAAVGLGGVATISARGQTLSTELRIPEGADPDATEQMQQSLKNSATSILPEKAVGVGAKWRLTEEMNQNGIDLKQVTTFELLKLDGDAVTLRVAIAQETLSTTASLPNLPPGSTAEFVHFESAGTGTSQLDLGHVSPTSSAVEVALDMRMAVSAAGQAMEIGTAIATQIDIVRE